MTFQYSKATPSFKSLHGGIKSFNGQTLAVGGTSTFPLHPFYLIPSPFLPLPYVGLFMPSQCLQQYTASATGTQFTVVDTAGTTYRIYALSSITLTATSASTNSGTISAGGQFTGVLRLVKLAQASHQALLDQHYQVYPTSVGHDYSFTDTTGTLYFTWDTVGDGSQLLMLTWPHHRTKMQNPNFPQTTALGYLTIKVHLSPSFLRQSLELTSPRNRDGCTPRSATGGACFTSSRPSRGMRRAPLILRARAPSSMVSSTR